MAVEASWIATLGQTAVPPAPHRQVTRWPTV